MRKYIEQRVRRSRKILRFILSPFRDGNVNFNLAHASASLPFYTLQNLDELLDHKSNLSDKLCQIGDSIVYKLVQWTKRLPFYLELPVEVHTTLLTHKWHEILVLTTSAYQAIHGQHKFSNVGSDAMGADFMQEVITSSFFLCLSFSLLRCVPIVSHPVYIYIFDLHNIFLPEQYSYLFDNKEVKYTENVAFRLASLLSRTQNETNFS